MCLTCTVYSLPNCKHDILEDKQQRSTSSSSNNNINIRSSSPASPSSPSSPTSSSYPLLSDNVHHHQQHQQHHQQHQHQLSTTTTAHNNAQDALVRMGGPELKHELDTAVPIEGFKGCFRTAFEVMLQAQKAENNTINLVVSVGQSRFLWSLRTRIRSDGELQLGVVVSALTPCAIGCDVAIKVVLPASSSPSSASGGGTKKGLIWRGVVLPFKSHEKRMNQGGGLLLLYPTHNWAFGAIDEEGKAQVMFSTSIKPEEGTISQNFLRCLQCAAAAPCCNDNSSSSSHGRSRCGPPALDITKTNDENGGEEESMLSTASTTDGGAAAAVEEGVWCGLPSLSLRSNE